MSFLTVDDFLALPLGVDLSAYTDPMSDEITEAGRQTLAAVLDKALVMLGDYVGMPLGFHVKYDETHPILDPNLTCWPLEAPVRTVQMFGLLMAAQAGARQSWSIPIDPIETTYGPAIPLLTGNVQMDRTYNMLRVTSYAGALGFPWASMIQMASQIVLTYTAGYDTADPSQDVMVDTTVAASPTPTRTSFAVTAGWGPQIRTNRAIAVGLQTSVVQGVSGDLVTVAPAFATAPAAGDRVVLGDGVSLPAPDWLRELERDTAREVLRSMHNMEMGITTVGRTQVGNLLWSTKDIDIDLPGPVKDSLDRHFGILSAELA